MGPRFTVKKSFENIKDKLVSFKLLKCHNIANYYIIGKKLQSPFIAMAPPPSYMYVDQLSCYEINRLQMN